MSVMDEEVVIKTEEVEKRRECERKNKMTEEERQCHRERRRQRDIERKRLLRAQERIELEQKLRTELEQGSHSEEQSDEAALRKKEMQLARINRKRLAERKALQDEEKLREEALRQQQLKQWTTEEMEAWIAERNRQLREEMAEEKKRHKNINQYMYRVATRAKRLSEGRADELREIYRTKATNYRKSLTEEKRQHYKRYMATAAKKVLDKMKQDPEKWEKHKETLRQYQRERCKKETPEQRQKRLLRCRLNAARRKLRAQLEQGEITDEQAQLKLAEPKKTFFQKVRTFPDRDR